MSEDNVPQARDWGPSGVDWRDESKDEDMAMDWLHATHYLEPHSTAVFDRVGELVVTDLDPARGWRLAQTLVRRARDDHELSWIGSEVLSGLVANHERLVAAELAELVKTEPKFRQALKGQISRALFNFEKRFGLRYDDDAESRPT